MRVFVSGDLRQIEWRCAAFLSQDPVMCAEIRAGECMHMNALRDYFPKGTTKTYAKIFNFRAIFGGSAYAYYKDPKMPAFSQKVWYNILDAFWEKYAGLRKTHIGWVQEVQAKGKLKSPTGRLLKFKKYSSKDGSGDAYSKNQIYNYPVQSLAMDIISLAMTELRSIQRREGWDAVMVNQIHDDILYNSINKEANHVKDTMLSVYNSLPHLIKQRYGFTFNLPLTGECKIGPNWLDMT